MGEFFALAAIHFLAVVAPGPDFVVTIRQSVRYVLQAVIGTAIGIGVGISVHVVYTLFGVGALMHGAPKLLSVVELIGGLYLLFLGVNFVYQAGKNTQAITIADHGQPQGKINFKKSFLLGFFTNATNPKATLFFL